MKKVCKTKYGHCCCHSTQTSTKRKWQALRHFLGIPPQTELQTLLTPQVTRTLTIETEKYVFHYSAMLPPRFSQEWPGSFNKKKFFVLLKASINWRWQLFSFSLLDKRKPFVNLSSCQMKRKRLLAFRRLSLSRSLSSVNIWTQVLN